MAHPELSRPRGTCISVLPVLANCCVPSSRAVPTSAQEEVPSASFILQGGQRLLSPGKSRGQDLSKCCVVVFHSRLQASRAVCADTAIENHIAHSGDRANQKEMFRLMPSGCRSTVNLCIKWLPTAISMPSLAYRHTQKRFSFLHVRSSSWKM